MKRLLVIIAAIALGLLTSFGTLYAVVGRGRSPYFEAYQADVSGERAKAIVLYEKAVAGKGEPELKLSAKRRLSSLYTSQGGLERGATHLEEVVASPGASVADLLALIELEWRIGRRERLIGLYERLLRHPDTSKEDRREGAWRLMELGEIDNARRALQSASSVPNSEGALALYLRLLVHLGHYEEAEVSLASARESFPESPAILAAEGGLFLAQERLLEADATFKKAMELHPTLLRSLLDGAKVKERLGERGDAERLVRRAVSHYPGEMDAQWALAAMFLRDASRGAMSALAAARVACADLKDAFPHHGVSFDCAGRLALVEGDGARAESLFARAREVSPGLVEPGLKRAETFLSLGDPQQALRVYESLAQTFGDRLDVRVGRARVLAAVNEERRARSELEAVLREAPNYAPARVVLADLWKVGGREYAAETLYKEVLANQPWEVSARYGLADLLLTRGYVAMAAEQYVGILDQDPGDPMAHLKLAGALGKQGKIKLALDEVAQALELGLSPDVVAGESTLDNIANRPDFKRLLNQHR